MSMGDERAIVQLADAGAAVLVATAVTDGYPWLWDRLGNALGEAYADELESSRSRLAAVSASASRSANTRADEMGQWRARLHDALTDRPDRAAGLRGLVEEASVRLIVAGSGSSAVRLPPDPALVPVGQATAAGPASARAPHPAVLAVTLLLLVLAGAVAAWYAARL